MVPDIEDAMNQSGGARHIPYRDMVIVAPMNDVREALESIQDTSPESRIQIKDALEEELDEMYPDICAGTAELDEAMAFGQNISIWFAFKIFEGKETLEGGLLH